MRAAKKDTFLCRVQEIMIERRHKMRILYFFMVVCLVLTFGCAGMKPERTVLQDNVFYSSTSPKIKIKIHSDFKYIGKAEKLKWSESVEKTATTHFEGESYLFGHIEDDKILKGVVIRIFTLGETNWYWLADLFSGVKDKLDSGVVKIKGKNYQHIVAPFSRLFSKDEADFISDKGYIIPSCFLVKGLGRIVSADGRTKMYIFYIEDIRHIHGNKYSCRDWLDKYMLTNEQHGFMKGFVARSEENIQILGKKEVAVSPEPKESPKLAAKETALPATSIDKVVIGVLDFETTDAWGFEGGKKALMKELRRNTRVKVVDIRESSSLSDLKRHGYLRGEWFKKIYQLDMILHIFGDSPRASGYWKYYFSLIDLYTKRTKEVSSETPRGLSAELVFRGISRKILVSQDLNRVLRAKKEALGE